MERSLMMHCLECILDEHSRVVAHRRSVFVSLSGSNIYSPLSQDGSPAPPAATETSFTFRAPTREVIVVVIAVDSHNRPVLDLTPTDLQL